MDAESAGGGLLMVARKAFLAADVAEVSISWTALLYNKKNDNRDHLPMEGS